MTRKIIAVDCSPLLEDEIAEDKTVFKIITGAEETAFNSEQQKSADADALEQTTNQNIFQAKRQAIAAFKTASTVPQLKAALVDFFRLAKMVEGLE